jgi:tetratricopeptide (TPR) repeat protein
VNQRDEGRGAVAPPVPLSALDRIQERLRRVLADDISAVLDDGADELEVVNQTDPTPGPDVSRVQFLNALAENLVTSVAPGDRTALLAAVAILQLAVRISESVADRLRSLSNLSYVLSEFYEVSGDALALTEATRMARTLIANTSPDTREYAGAVHRLADMLRLSYAATADVQVLEELISLLRSAVGDVATEGVDYADLVTKLATSLAMRHSATGDTRALREAVQMLRGLVEQLPPQHPAYAGALNNLGLEVITELGEEEAFEEVADLYRTALARTAPSDEVRSCLLTNLAGLLADHAKRTGAAAEADEALFLARQAVSATKVDPRALLVLAIILGIRHEQAGDPADFDDAIELLRKAAGAGLDEHDRADALYHLALLRHNRYFGTRAEADARTALTAWLEAAKIPGASVRRRTESVTNAAKIHADLQEWPQATELIGQAIDRLPAAAGRQLSRSDREQGIRMFRELPVIAAVYAVRAGMPDLALDFLERGRNVLSAADTVRLPLSRVLSALQSGPVVMPIAGLHWSGALIATADGVRQVDLPQLTEDNNLRSSRAYFNAVDTITDPASTDAECRQAEGSIQSFLGWMWDAIAEPVLDALGFTSPPEPGTLLPRIWWCPVGYLSYFPLHAAGRLDSPGVQDLAISSYTASIQALHSTAPWTPAPDTQPLMVAMPCTPGLGILPAVEHEIPVLASHFPDCLILSGAAATRKAVLSALPDHDIAHFACHGGSDPDHDHEGRLFVHDGVLGLADIARTRTGRPGLAFLSACSTAQRRIDIPDESLSLANRFQLAGFSHVVGSLWPIGDRAALEVMTNFYAELLADGNVAKALHLAVGRLRASAPDEPSLWTPYVHFGP